MSKKQKNREVTVVITETITEQRSYTWDLEPGQTAEDAAKDAYEMWIVNGVEPDELNCAVSDRMYEVTMADGSVTDYATEEVEVS